MLIRSTALLRPQGATAAATRQLTAATAKAAIAAAPLNTNLAGHTAAATTTPLAFGPSQPTAATRNFSTASTLRFNPTLRVASANTSTSGDYKNILVSSPAEGVTLITLNRPKALNALNSALIAEVNEAATLADEDPSINAIILTGSEKAFAAGADITEMADMEFSSAYKNNFLGHWTKISTIRKPIIGAVSGFALGGGCELAMMCDILLASPTAQFGQPEINLGVIPGAGGSQRFTKALGKSLSMELTLTGRFIDGQEAASKGLISRVVPEGTSVVDEAVKIATTIGKKSQVAVQAAKEAINASYELPLNEGLRFERRLFQALFATKDQKEGMAAFKEKRKPKFSNE